MTLSPLIVPLFPINKNLSLVTRPEICQFLGETRGTQTQRRLSSRGPSVSSLSSFRRQCRSGLACCQSKLPSLPVYPSAACQAWAVLARTSWRVTKPNHASFLLIAVALVHLLKQRSVFGQSQSSCVLPKILIAILKCKQKILNKSKHRASYVRKTITNTVYM